jgi:hypothetical protein
VSSEEKIRVELNGEGVTLDTVDPLELLELSTRYLDLLLRTAADSQIPLALHGIYVEPGSARHATRVSDPKAAELANQRVLRLVSGEEKPTPALRVPTDALKATLGRLPPGHVAAVISLHRREPLIPRDVPAWRGPASITKLRANLIQVGGKEPKAKFSSRFERNGEAFSVTVTAVKARDLARHLYDELEITLRLRRDEDGKIIEGELLDYVQVSSGNAFDAWQRWYRENASEWDDVADIEEALGRDGP